MAAADTAAPLRRRLERQRADLVAAAAGLATAGEARRLTLAEETTLEGYLGDLERLEVRAAAITPPAPAVVKREPLTYERGGPNSFLVDVAFQGERPGAADRLKRHAQEMAVELERRRAAEERMLAEAVAAGEISGYERRTNPNTTQGQGGYFAAPLWMLDEWGALGRSGRPLGSMVPNRPLPKGVVSISVPRFTVNPTVAPQTADAASIAMPDFTDAGVTAPVRTVSGSALISQQLRDQGGVNGIDDLLFADLAEDYSMKLEQQSLNGSGSSGQNLGALNVSGITAVSYTDATPTVPELIPVLGQAYAQFGSNRLQPPEVWLMAPRRWGWMASQVDSTGRALVDLSEGWEGGPLTGGAVPVGSIFGTPVVVDGAMPLTLSTNQDAVLAVKASDMRLWEGDLLVGAAVDHAGSANLQVRLLARRSVAFIAGRVPTGIAAVTGTGLAQVANYG